LSAQRRVPPFLSGSIFYRQFKITTSLSTPIAEQPGPFDSGIRGLLPSSNNHRIGNTGLLQVDIAGQQSPNHDARALLNYYNKLNSRAVLRQRYPGYSRKRDADLLRSEHIPFNLLAPLDTNREVAASIISNAWGIDCAEIQNIEIEYAPSPKEKYLSPYSRMGTSIFTA